jgi:hypothetical protein
VVGFRSDKVELYEVDGELELDVPVIDIELTAGCPASIVDVAELSSEHDSVQAASEVLCAGIDAVSDEMLKLEVRLDDVVVDCRASIAEVDESAQAAPVLWLTLDEVEMSDVTPLEIEVAPLAQKVDVVGNAVKPDFATISEVTFGNK